MEIPYTVLLDTIERKRVTDCRYFEGGKTIGKKESSYTLGSLFDGIGGFPYAASFYNIKPLWASEIMPSAVSITKRHFPAMEHVGDVTQLHGGKLPPVDIITFGSPCQGLSVAGKRLGLADERSGLFSEAIRIIREMREATHGEYPQIAIWENVPGALSSDGGRDFKTVLEAFTEDEVPMPRSGRWANAGMVRSGGIDLAWCVYNAQHFGVPQRRRRVFLIVDFRGQCAGEILFIPKSLRGYFSTGGTPRQGAAANACRGAEAAGGAAAQLKPDGDSPKSCACVPQLARTLMARADSSPCADRGQNVVVCAASGHTNAEIMTDQCPTLTCVHDQPLIAHPKTSGTLCGSGAGLSRPAGMASECDFCVTYCVQAGIINRKAENGPSGSGIKENLSFTLLATDHPHAVTDAIPINDKATRYKGGGPSRNGDGSGNGLGVGKAGDPSPTLTAGDRHAVAAVDCRNCRESPEMSGTLQAKATGGYSLNFQNPVRRGYVVRRLTPVECERLQGYPDNWTAQGCDGKPISDARRYQMLGNSVAVPCVAYIMQGIRDALKQREGSVDTI